MQEEDKSVHPGQTMPLNKAQAVAGSDARFRIFVASEENGENISLSKGVSKICTTPNKRVLYICQIYQMGRDIIWADLKERLGKLNWIAKTNESRLELTLVNDSVISIRSGDNPRCSAWWWL